MAERIIKVRLSELVAGDIIAKEVYSNTGSILVKKNLEVSDSIIQKLFKSYNDYIFVYRKVSDENYSYNININQIIVKEVEDIIDATAQKFLKQNKDINQIKKVLLEILNSEHITKLLIPIRPMGENVFNHSINVALYALLVGKEMHMPYNRLKVLGTAALLHDIGMQKVPKDIIYKAQSLNEAEKQILQMHPRYGFEILQQKNNFNLEITSIVLQHHERYDGNGYPNNLKNDRIHQMAKIISMCDIFDALTSDRPYRQKFEKNESIEYLLRAGENNYSSEMIQGLVNSISIYPFGKWVKLSTGEIGIIGNQEEENILNYRPIVIVYIDVNGNELETPIPIDLSLRVHDDIAIEKII
jgi:putative nucleotidyltransferase with HDIG domain